MDFANELQACVNRANDALRRFIEPQPFQNTPLVEAMHYGALLGGKRLRPFLVYATGNMFGISDNTLDAPAAALAQAFTQVSLQRPRCAYLSGSTARVLWDPQRIADDLAMNMARTVRWQEAVISANEREARLAIEMPPGGVLTCLTRQAAWEGESISLERSGVDVAVHLAKRLRA